MRAHPRSQGRGLTQGRHLQALLVEAELLVVDVPRRDTGRPKSGLECGQYGDRTAQANALRRESPSTALQCVVYFKNRNRAYSSNRRIRVTTW
jgi:hypothetical protein